jgi:hypothetical protein
MATITITLKGVPPYDGPYTIDMNETELTNRDWEWLKRYSATFPSTLGDAIEHGDASFWCAMALILLRRAGRIDKAEAPAVFEQLEDAPYSAVGVEVDVREEDDAGPPPPSSSSNGTISGDDSSSSSETLVLPPKATGPLPSDTSRSVPATSVS